MQITCWGLEGFGNLNPGTSWVWKRGAAKAVAYQVGRSSGTSLGGLGGWGWDSHGGARVNDRSASHCQSQQLRPPPPLMSERILLTWLDFFPPFRSGSIFNQQSICPRSMRTAGSRCDLAALFTGMFLLSMREEAPGQRNGNPDQPQSAPASAGPHTRNKSPHFLVSM